MLLTNYLLTVGHLESALDNTIMLLLYYYSILLQILPETMNVCYLHMLCSFFFLLLCLLPFLGE